MAKKKKYIRSLNQAQKLLVKQIKKVDLKIVSRDTNFEKIKAYYLNPSKYELSEKNEDIRARWQAIFTMKLNHMSDTEIVNILGENGMSHAQAYNDIRNSSLLFGDVTATDPMAQRVVLQHYAMDVLRRCQEDGDYENELKALKLLADFSGIYDDTLQSFNPEKLKNDQVRLAVSKTTEAYIKEIVAFGVVDMNSVPADDVDYTEINE